PIVTYGITVPNCNKVRSISWNADQFIAVGGLIFTLLYPTLIYHDNTIGDNGVLKVIKLESNLNSLNGSKSDNSKNFSHNQTLDSHKSSVQYVCWNEPFQKLTSSDDS